MLVLDFSTDVFFNLFVLESNFRFFAVPVGVKEALRFFPPSIDFFLPKLIWKYGCWMKIK